MSVRHIHARRGEHIRVHRSHGGGGGGGSSEGEGCLLLIGIGIGIWVLYYTWQIVLGILLVAGAIWLICVFWEPICSFGAWIWKGLKRLTQSSKNNKNKTKGGTI